MNRISERTIKMEEVMDNSIEIDPTYQAVIIIKPDGIDAHSIPELIRMLLEHNFLLNQIKFFNVNSEDGHILWDHDIAKTSDPIKIKFLTRLIEKFNGSGAALIVSRKDDLNPWEYLNAIKGRDYRSPMSTIRGRLSYHIPDEIEDPELFCDLAIKTRIHLPKDEQEVHILSTFLADKGIFFRF